MWNYQESVVVNRTHFHRTTISWLPYLYVASFMDMEEQFAHKEQQTITD